MAKTFNPNRIGGGTFSLVQDAQGNYSIKETGFDPVKSLNMIDLGAIAATTTAKKTETAADKTDTTTTDQTKQAFLLPKKDDKDDADRQANLFTRATDLSSGLQNTFDRPNMRDVAGEVTRIKDPTESVFGRPNMREIAGERRMTAEEAAPQETLGLKAPEVKLETQTAKQRTGKARIRGPRDLETQTGVAFGRPEEGTIDQAASGAAINTTDKFITPFEGARTIIRNPNYIEPGSTLGISAEPSATRLAKEADFASGTLDARVPDAIREGQPAVAARKTFSESVKTALKGFKTPAMAVLESVGDALTNPQQRSLNNSNAAALGSLGYRTRGELGSSTDPGRIAGNPADNVFAGMNLKSARGNVMTASKARIDKIRASAAKTTDKAKAARMKAKAAKFERQRQEALDRKEKQQAAKNKKDLATGGVAPGASGGGSGGCFIKGTLVTMANGSKKPIEKINLGDYVAEGGKVFATGKFLINDLYNYKGIKVSGSHMVKENNVWTRVEDSRYGKLINTDEHVVYIFGSENRRILIDNILFTDYFEITDQEKLISEKDKFFDNWKIHEANEDINNINILNAN